MKRPAVTSARVSDAQAVVCSVCGRSPAAVLDVRRVVGVVVLMRRARIEGAFCRPHGIEIAKHYLRRTMLEGWWGIPSVFVNCYVVYVDRRALRRARRLPFPTVETAVVPAGLPNDVAAVFGESDELRAARKSVVRTVATSIGLGVAILITSFVARDSSAPVTRRFAMGSALTVLLYALVAVLASGQLAGTVIRPRLVDGPLKRAVTIGAVSGLAAGLLAAAFVSLTSGKLTSDPSMIAIFSEHQVVPILVVIFVAVAAAPMIEEVLFRGLLVESFRARGRTSAILGGAVAFSLWHLNPVALRYYVVMGFLLGYLYWRFGLAGSISAHAVFNSTLVVLAFASLAGGPLAVSGSGVALDMPRSWHVVDDLGPPSNEPGRDGIDEASVIELAVESPVGATLVVQRITGSSLHRHVRSPNDALRSLPAGASDPRYISISGGPAVRFALTLLDGTPSEVVVVPKGKGVFVVTLVNDGSNEAKRQFEAMLATLRLAPILSG